MARSVFVVQHVPFEGPALIAPALAARGLAIETARQYEPGGPAFDPARHAGLVVMGGPMNAEQHDRYPFLAREIEWLRAALAAETPTLGVCLGCQLLASAGGSRVYPNRVKEIGFLEVEATAAAAEDLLLRPLGPRQAVLQWHGDTFDLPAGAVLLARAATCEHQAFRLGPRAWGLQFHLEVTAEVLDRWLSEPGMCGELNDPALPDAETLRRDGAVHFPKLAPLAAEVFTAFAAMCAER